MPELNSDTDGVKLEASAAITGLHTMPQPKLAAGRGLTDRAEAHSPLVKKRSRSIPNDSTATADPAVGEKPKR